MKIMMLGDLRETPADEAPFLLRPAGMVLMATALVLGFLVYNEVKIERSHSLRGLRKKRRR